MASLQGCAKPVLAGMLKFHDCLDPAGKVFNKREVDELLLIDIVKHLSTDAPDFESIDEYAQDCFMPLGYRTVFSRSRLSDDNAYTEPMFRTTKYRPDFPRKGFDTLDAARAWAMSFLGWYNFEHRHSGIQDVSPAQRHTGRMP